MHSQTWMLLWSSYLEDDIRLLPQGVGVFYNLCSLFQICLVWKICCRPGTGLNHNLKAQLPDPFNAVWSCCNPLLIEVDLFWNPDSHGHYPLLFLANYAVSLLLIPSKILGHL